jgi:excisionase family DNA binding protein
MGTGEKERLTALQRSHRESDTVPGGSTHVDRQTISIMKACELVGVSRRTIYNWLSSGKVEYVRTAGGSVRIFVDSLWRDPHRPNRPNIETVWPPAQEPETKRTAYHAPPAKSS